MGRRCGTCEWLHHESVDHGVCEFPMPVWAKEALLRTRPIQMLSGDTMCKDWGADCPTWKERGV